MARPEPPADARRAAACLAGLCLVLACAAPARAGALQLPAPPPVGFAPESGSRLPLDAVLRDEQGRDAPLAHWFGAHPVVLVPGYYRCPNLCGTVFEGVLQALALGRLEAGEYRLLGVSVDPREDAAAAAQRRAAYAQLLAPGASLALLRGERAALARIEAALGYRATPDAQGYAHAAGFVVAAADGRIVRVFTGVRFDPAALRAALRAAAGAGPLAPVPQPPGQRLLLLCSHYAPLSGRNAASALFAVRGVALLVPLALAGFVWRRLVRGAKGGKP